MLPLPAHRNVSPQEQCCFVIYQMRAGLKYFLTWHLGNLQIFKGIHLPSQLFILLGNTKTLRNVHLSFYIFFTEFKISTFFLGLLIHVGYHLMPIALASQLLLRQSVCKLFWVNKGLITDFVFA